MGNGGGPAPDRCVANNFGKHECHKFPMGSDEFATCPSEDDGETVAPSEYVHVSADVLAKCHTECGPINSLARPGRIGG